MNAEASDRERHGTGAKALLGGVLAALLAAGAIAIPGAVAAGPAATASGTCTKATDIEAIIDDSGSMEITDPDRLRVQAMNLLIDSLSPGTSLGAVEFGGAIFEGESGADTVFPPEPIGANAAAMRTAMKEKINADNGLTDYNAAFAQSDLDNPAADARIFLTDGGHDVGEYNNGHLVHPVPTYVVGFSSAISASADRARLKQIANSTGGSFFALEDSSDLQAVSNSIASALTCQTPPQTFKDELAAGAAKEHSLTIGAATKAVQVVLTWANPKNRFKLSGFRLVQGKRLVALGRRQKPRKLKVTVKATSTTFTIVQVSGLSRGKLHFKVHAAKVAGGGKVKVTTQVSQRAHR
jgi:hypothetical protein